MIASSLASILSTFSEPQETSRLTLGLFIPIQKDTARYCLMEISRDHIEDPVGFWISLLQDFTLSLSDQQLISGLLLVITAIAKYRDISDLTVARDLVYFSIVTHFATILPIRQMLRDDIVLAILRMSIAFITLACWLSIVIFCSLHVHKSQGYPTIQVSLRSYAMFVVFFFFFFFGYFGRCISSSLQKI